MKNKIYLISQEENTDYDTYDSAVVVAPDVKTAKRINPDKTSNIFMTQKDWEHTFPCWCSSPAKVKVKYIGEADDKQKIGVICASFNAG
jgi:hypothetical protein